MVETIIRKTFFAYMIRLNVDVFGVTKHPKCGKT